MDRIRSQAQGLGQGRGEASAEAEIEAWQCTTDPTPPPPPFHILSLPLGEPSASMSDPEPTAWMTLRCAVLCRRDFRRERVSV